VAFSRSQRVHLGSAAAAAGTLSSAAGNAMGCVGILVTGGVCVFFSVQHHYFTVNFSNDSQKSLELRTDDSKDCDEWVAAIARARYVSP